jgi:uncharacterized protein (UPF0179 family)
MRRKGSSTMTKKARPALAVALLALTALMASACANGTVQAKRDHCCDALHMHVYELCVGESVSNCTWIRLTSKTDDLDYRQCSIGKKYPDCRNLF